MVLGGVAEEVDDFHQFLFGLILARYVRKRHLGPFRVVLAGLASSEAEDILLAAAHLPTHQHDKAEEEQERKEAEKQAGPDRSGGCPAFDLDASGF